MLYLDSSALAKLYLAEPESRAVSELVKNHEPGLFTSRLGTTCRAHIRCRDGSAVTKLDTFFYFGSFATWLHLFFATPVKSPNASDEPSHSKSSGVLPERIVFSG